MMELNLSKQQVLKEIYVREIPLIFFVLRERRRKKELEHIYDLQRLLEISTATAGMCPSKELIDKIFDDLQKRYFQLNPSVKSNETPKDPYEQLERLQKTISQTQTRKRR